MIEVEVPTTVNGALMFASGANVGLTLSWDVWKHGRNPIEIYGEDGVLLVEAKSHANEVISTCSATSAGSRFHASHGIGGSDRGCRGARADSS